VKRQALLTLPVEAPDTAITTAAISRAAAYYRARGTRRARSETGKKESVPTSSCQPRPVGHGHTLAAPISGLGLHPVDGQRDQGSRPADENGVGSTRSRVSGGDRGQPVWADRRGAGRQKKAQLPGEWYSANTRPFVTKPRAYDPGKARDRRFLSRLHGRRWARRNSGGSSCHAYKIGPIFTAEA